MKYHLLQERRKITTGELVYQTVCGKDLNPKLFVYDLRGFIQHHDEGSRCKRCNKILLLNDGLIEGVD